MENPETFAATKILRPSFDEYFLLFAKLASVRSTCNSRPNGAVIVKDHQVIATGYNGALPGLEHCLGQEIDCGYCGGTGEIACSSTHYEKCPACNGTGQIPYCHRRAQGTDDANKQNVCRSNHAEANAIAMAAAKGHSVCGADIYCTLAPCAVCLKLLKAAEIRHIFYETDYEEFNSQGYYADEQTSKITLAPEVMDLVITHLQRPSERRLPRTS